MTDTDTMIKNTDRGKAVRSSPGSERFAEQPGVTGRHGSYLIVLTIFLAYQLWPINSPLERPRTGGSLLSFSEAQAQFGPFDCDSLEDALRVLEDTVAILPSFAQAGETLALPVYVKNDSILGGFAFIYTFDTSLLTPVIDTQLVIQCDQFTCDTTLDFFIVTTQTARLNQSGLIARGPFDTSRLDVARLVAIPIIPEVDSLAPGGDTLCYQHFMVRPDAELGCFANFEFITRQVWQQISENPPESAFAGCQMNEFAVIVQNFPETHTPSQSLGIFRVGNTASISCGDANADGLTNIGDVTFLIARIFNFGPAPCSIGGLGDPNCDGKVNIADVTFLIQRIFAAGPAPCCPPGI
ncbi:MAG: hypothetical protein ACE5GA_11155 [Candidatus Zixiibacteriota bacterium]